MSQQSVPKLLYINNLRIMLITLIVMLHMLLLMVLRVTGITMNTPGILSLLFFSRCSLLLCSPLL